MFWKDHFCYDETSPSCLRWARNAANGRVKIGDVAGCLSGKLEKEKKYYRVYCLNRSYAVSRIIWEMFNGEIPEGKQVDHININPQDNRIDNLRIVDNIHNSQNRKKSKSNTSGVTGVSITDNGNGRLYWVAQWNDNNGKRCGRMFSIDKYGYEQAFTLACEVREKEIIKLNENNMDYSERHGK